MMMQTPLLPAWLRVVWIVGFCAVAVLHLRHSRVMAGPLRYWHAGHVLMGVGMAYMYLPHSAQPLPDGAGRIVFAVAAAAAAVAAVRSWFRDGALNPLWILAVVEMAVMVYMFLPMGTRPLLLSYGLAAYLVALGALWALGAWDHHYLVHYRPAAGWTDHSHVGRTSPVLRASLATMTAGMSYMLLVM